VKWQESGVCHGCCHWQQEHNDEIWQSPGHAPGILHAMTVVDSRECQAKHWIAPERAIERIGLDENQLLDILAGLPFLCPILSVKKLPPPQLE